jgi:anti-sigma factor RsiW
MAERPEACPEWREDLADWVVAQVLPDREAALLAHLAGCPACTAEADSLLAVAAVVLAVDADPAVAAAPGLPGPAPERVDPPADLRDRIAGRIASERRGRLLRRMAVSAVGAAAAAAVVVGAVLVVADDDPGRLDGERFVLAVGSGEAIVAPYDGGSSSEVQLIATGLEPDTTYALWLAVPGGGRDDRIPAGTFRTDEDGEVDTRLHCAMPAGEVGRVWATSPELDLVLDTEPA